MDLDIEMGDAADMAHDSPSGFDTAAYEHARNQSTGTASAIDATGNSTPQDGDIQTRVPNKVHIRGLDALTTDEIKAYVASHHGSAPLRVEWIDDTSANLLFDTEASARDAIVALSVLPLNDPTQLPPLEVLLARPLAAKPDAALSIRFALTGDRKQAGAASRSRFYLLNPEYDPEERRRRDRQRYWDRSNDGSRYGGGRRRARDDDEIERFDESFYDEPSSGPSLARRVGRRSRTPEHDRPDDGHAKRRGNGDKELFSSSSNRDKELFPSGGGGSREKELFPALRGRDRSGSARDRSASPTRRRDRSRSPSRSPSPDRGRYGRQSLNRDDARSRNMMLGRALKDRITHSCNGSSSKDLFSSNTTSKHKIAGFNAKNRLDQLETVFGSARLETEDQIHPDDMVAAPSIGGTSSRHHRNNNTTTTTSNGLSIKGAAAARIRGTSDFTIKGSASKSARELFPDKLGGGGGAARNQGKELFSRPTQKRQTAGDFLY